MPLPVGIGKSKSWMYNLDQVTTIIHLLRSQQRTAAAVVGEACLGCQTLVLTRVLLPYFGQIDNCLFDPSYGWLQFNLLDIAPQILEVLDRLHIGRPDRPFRDQLIDHIEDTAELLSITVRRNNLSPCFR